MPRVVGIDHLVLSVGNFARSKTFYGKVLGFLGFKLKHEYPDMAGWSNAKTLFWIAAADTKGKTHKYRKGDIGFHHYAFELSSRRDLDDLGAFLPGERSLATGAAGRLNSSATRRSWQAKEERHGQGSNAQQQGKEETEAGQEQEGQGRRAVAVHHGTGSARAESLRQERSVR